MINFKYAGFKKNKQFLCTIILLIAILPDCAAQSVSHDKKPEPFFFIQMADPQFGMYTDNKGFVKETKNFEKAIEAANRLRPAFVIVCGDLVNGSGAQHLDQRAEYKRIAGKLEPSIPLYNVAGNHDVRNRPTPTSLAKYRKNFGEDYYTFKSHKLFGIVLNSSLFFDPSGAQNEAAKQKAWLRTTLKKAAKLKNMDVVVFQHIPWFIQQAEEKDEYFNIPRAQRSVYLNLFHKYEVKYIFAGHLHRNAIGRDGDLTMITTGPIGKPLGKDPSGFRIVKVNGNRITSQYYSLDSIPTTLELKNSTKYPSSSPKSGQLEK